MKSKKDFLSITDLTAKEIWQVILLAKKLKKSRELKQNHLYGKQMVMIFEKPSLRTKLSFTIGFNRMGGESIYFGPQEIGLGNRESVEDVAKVISSQANLIVARVFSHKQLIQLSQNSSVPVINALSNLEHPCQALADFFTILEAKRKLEGLTLAFIGDGENNITHSLLLGCALLGINFKCATPNGFWMKKGIVKKAKKINGSIEIMQTENPKKAVVNADIVYTDTWVSMGDEKEQEKRLKLFKPFQVNKELMKFANKEAIFMHDLPAYRDNEVTADIIDSPQSIVFQQAENRLYAQQALILFLMKTIKTLETVKSHSFSLS